MICLTVFALFAGTVRENLLEPVEEYITLKPERIACGTGLTAIVSAQNVSKQFTAEKLNFVFDVKNPPAEGICGEYTLELNGNLLPRYDQKYQLIFEYTGNPDSLRVILRDEEVVDAASSLDAVKSKQFVPTAGCKHMIITRNLTAGEFCPIRIQYQGDISKETDRLKLLWWSTTQQMGTVIRERLYP